MFPRKGNGVLSITLQKAPKKQKRWETWVKSDSGG